MINPSRATCDILQGTLNGKDNEVTKVQRTISNTLRMYANTEGIDQDVLDQINYRVEVFKVDENEGGLQFGTSYLYPGTINGEYFMTKGHYHAIANRTEFYLCLKGEGLLLLMDRDRHWWTEEVEPNSLHYIQGNVAHRLINTSSEILTVLACWNSDAGHDYASIEEEGFSVRYFKIDGEPTPVEQG